jgi:hypothetical protein
MSQSLTGLTANEKYTLIYSVNARNCCGTGSTTYSVNFGDATLVDNEEVQPVGGGRQEHPLAVALDEVGHLDVTEGAPRLELGQLEKARLVVDNPEGNDRMTLHVEVADNASSDTGSIIATLRDVTKLRGEIRFHAPGEIANDGKVIDDTRKYD